MASLHRVIKSLTHKSTGSWPIIELVAWIFYTIGSQSVIISMAYRIL